MYVSFCQKRLACFVPVVAFKCMLIFWRACLVLYWMHVYILHTHVKERVCTRTKSKSLHKNRYFCAGLAKAQAQSNEAAEQVQHSALVQQLKAQQQNLQGFPQLAGAWCETRATSARSQAHHADTGLYKSPAP